jgi:glycosyltransferase involved in cell wall biosynthesis
MRREGRCLAGYERALAARARRDRFLWPTKKPIFSAAWRPSAPEGADHGQWCRCGLFCARPGPRKSVPPGELPVVFTGAMDYWPNIDAVTWFAAEVLPALRARWPTVRFVVVGRSPPPSMQALASDAITVTGTVPDVRPYLQHAKVVVAPMRLARGVQNKVLEAMAMGRPVVAAAECVAAIDVIEGEEICAASSVADYVESITRLLVDSDRSVSLGISGRECVLRKYSWGSNMEQIDPFLVRQTPERSQARRTADQ